MSVGNICECGCNGFVKWSKRNNCWNRFIDGHNRKGKCHSKKSNRKNSDAHLGKRPSKETRERTSESLKGRYMGENSSQWRGGISSRKYSLEFSNWLKNSIRERDNHTCQLCGKEEQSRKLDVHHIDYDKDNCNPKNLISLCRICNSEVNSDREVWIRIFKRKIRNIYKQIPLMEKRK